MEKNKVELKPKFILSQELNRLAKWLRILGYDAVIYKSVNLLTIIRLAKKERRIFITRSQKKVKSVQKFSRILIKSENYLEQLREMKDYIRLNNEHIFTRCIICNKLLFEISPKKIITLIPEYIYQNHKDFKVCRKCGKIYWKGTHYQDMKNELSKLFF